MFAFLSPLFALVLMTQELSALTQALSLSCLMDSNVQTTWDEGAQLPADPV